MFRAVFVCVLAMFWGTILAIQFHSNLLPFYLLHQNSYATGLCRFFYRLSLQLPNWHISSKASHEVLGNLRRLDGVFQGQYLPTDFFTGKAAMLNLLEYSGMPRGHSLSIYARFSGKKRTSLYISREKGDHYYIQTRHNDLFIGKLKEKMVRKARLITEQVYRILLMPEAKTSQMTFDVCLIGQGGQN